MSIGKIVKTGAIAAGVTIGGAVGLAGYGVYKIIHGTKEFVADFYHRPSLKKAVAVAVIPFAIYGIRHPTGAVDGTSKAFQRTGNYIEERIDSWNDSRVKSISAELEKEESQLELLEAQKENLEKLVYKASKSPGSVQPMKQETGNQYLDRFADESQSMIFVDKDKGELHLLRSNGKSFVEVGKYSCTTGQNPLPKTMNGDKASPEGIFYAAVEDKEWNAKYTPAKLNISVPSSMGSGIVVTGTSDSEILGAIARHERVSNGGIVLSSGDYMDLHRKVSLESRVPIVITSSHTKTLLDYTGGAH